ncbi:hypothetical protein PIB30_065226 [Stylosanthes scabra]|uniref:Ubiquitin-like protease family profile domain-containing protein n=1 Tax=Stylosanthes scabra TaxID=79078 RepID=A0ABU6WK74_9FABA|nr:hypothetical protein [Stylosanthes scabra]
MVRFQLGRDAQGMAMHMHKPLWCVRIGSGFGLQAFLCDLLVPRALFSHFRFELCPLKSETLERTHKGTIYIPICSDGHWFLLLIDTPSRELVYLDSLASDKTKAKRRRDIKNTAVFLEELLDHDDWYDDPKKGRLLCSDFDIVQPTVVQ